MGSIIVVGGNRLSGEVNITGAKNAILPILAATVIGANESTIFNVPALRDVEVMEKILISLGCRVKKMGRMIWVDSKPLDNFRIPEELVMEMRSSIIFMGALLSRIGEVVISYPGGCEIGPRPIDMHFKALQALGANIEESHGFIYCNAKRLKGCEIQLDYPSVGTTENIMLAAVKAEGTTIIRNAAREPEIIDLQNYLNKAGAKVKGAGTSVVIINGVDRFNNVDHNTMPDRIVAGTYMVASAITEGEIVVKNIIIDHLQAIIAKLKETNCQIYNDNNSLKIVGPKKINPIEMLQTLPYPGFPTDMQAQMMALLTIANGTSIISETVFENRFKHAEELIRMGANIKVIGRVSVVKGVKELTGAKTIAKDLRGGASLILAGLSANGVTEIGDVYHIERGYEDIHLELAELGANIRKAD